MVRAYVELSNMLYMSNPDTVIVLCRKAKEITELNLSKGVSDTIVKKKYQSSLAEALNNIGAIYDDQGKIHAAADFYKQSLEIYDEIGHKLGMATSLNNIGYIYMHLGDIEAALDYYHKSLKIKEELGNKKGLAISLNNIGYIYRNQGDVEKGLEYYFKSLAIQEEVGDRTGQAYSLTNIGTIYEYQKKSDLALEYYNKSLRIQEEISYKYGMVFSLGHIATVYSRNGEKDKALSFYERALQISDNEGFKDGQAISLRNIGAIFLDAGNFILAEEYANRSLEVSLELGFPARIRYASLLLYEIHKREGNFEKALEMYELHIQMRDSIKNEATEKATIRQQTRYEFEKAQLVKEQEEKEVSRQQGEVRNRRDNLQYSVIFIAILVLFGAVMFMGFVNISERAAEGIIFFSFLILFEFFLVLADPYIDAWSGGAPGIKLLFNAGIAALIFPAHAFFESMLKRRIVK